MTRYSATRPSKRKQHRDGVATVEFAFTAPLLFLMIFAGIEITRVNQLRNTAEIAATEGARRGIIPGATAAEVIAAAEAELQAIMANEFQVTVQPQTITDETPTIAVDVEIPLDMSNGYFFTNLFTGGTVNKTIELQREQ